MGLDNEKIDEAVLALLMLGVHDGARAWKGFDWESMNRLHEKGHISDPCGKAKSVVFTERPSASERLVEQLFSEYSGTSARQPSEHVYAIVRFDRFLPSSQASFTVKEIMATQA